MATALDNAQETFHSRHIVLPFSMLDFQPPLLYARIKSFTKRNYPPLLRPVYHLRPMRLR
jgi:hypothetical protein